ncbi:hypothetical protein AAG906_003093 [Vitis piasezkii]
MTPTYLHPVSQSVFAAHVTERPPAPYTRYEIDGVSLGPQAPTPFSLIPDEAPFQLTHPTPLIVTRSGRIAQPPPPVVRPFEALGFAPSDFGPSTQTVRAYDSTKREVMGTLIHRVGAIPYSLHQKVKFIHDGQVITTRDMMSLAYYFVKGSEIRPRIEEIHNLVHTDREIELQHLFHQLQLSDGAPSASVSMVITPMSPNRASILSLCFPKEITNDGVVVDPTKMIDGVVPHDEYRDEMDMMTVSQITSIVQLQLVSPFDIIRLPPVMYSISAPHSPTSQIFDIDDEVAWPNPDRDSSDHDSDPVDERVSLAIGDVEPVDFHHLPILPHAGPVKQKLRRLHPRWSLQVKEEIQKQLSAGFISMVEYPEWLANVVPIPKKDGKVRVCVDFRDLNKASLEDDFPLPHIDLLVDSTVGHSMLSFMDGFSRLRLNPKKCTFRVTSGKLLGHMVSEWGIKVDPDKIRAILDMLAPKIEKEIKGFLGRLEYINRFIARLTDILPPTLGRPLLLYLSVSNMALGCMLAQLDDLGKKRAIYYLKFDIQYVSQKSIKGSIVVNHLASLPTSEGRPVDDDFPNEEFVAMASLSGWCMYFDGATKQSGYGISVLSSLIDRVMREVHARVCGPHMGGHMLDRKIMRTGYFWLTMETDLWGINIIGKVSPKSSNGHEFILVAIDYFIKWVEAASYARLISTRVASFIRSHIICRYRVPHELISDRGVHFRAEVDTLLQKYGATPYSLMYGMEFVLPVETKMGSLIVALEQQISETEWAQAWFDQLNLLDEKRLRVTDHVQAYHRKMARAFRKRVSLDHYKTGI